MCVCVCVCVRGDHRVSISMYVASPGHERLLISELPAKTYNKPGIVWIRGETSNDLIPGLCTNRGFAVLPD